MLYIHVVTQVRIKSKYIHPKTKKGKAKESEYRQLIMPFEFSALTGTCCVLVPNLAFLMIPLLGY